MEQSEIRSEFTSARTAVGKSGGSVFLGAFLGRRIVGSANASRRDSLRVQQHKAISSYDEMKHFMDRLVTKLDTVKSQVELSEEYTTRARKPITEPPAVTSPHQGYVFWAFLDNAVKGPFTIEQVAGLVTAHVANDTTLICTDGTEDWRGLYEVPELAHLV